MNDRQRRRTRIVLVVVMAAALVAGVLTAIPWNGDDDDATPTPRSLITPGTLLDAGGTRLASLLSGARDHTFHARYGVKGDVKLLGGKVTLEWWNKKGHSRIDTTRTSGDQTVRTASIVNGDEAANCQRTDNDAWTCKSITVPAAGDPGGIISTVTSQLSGRQVTESSTKVKGFAAQCFHVGGGSEPIDVCTNSDGVMLKNASPNAAYEIATLDTAVPDAIFDPPATVTR